METKGFYVRHILLSFLIVHTSLFGYAGTGGRKIASTTSPEAGAVQDFTKAFPSKKIKLSELIKRLEKKVPENYIEALREKAKPVQNETLEFEQLGGNKIVFKSQGNEAVVEVLSLDEGRFKVNNRATTIDFKLKPEFLLQDIEALFPQKTAMNPILLLFLPQAEAFWGWVLGIGVAAFGLYMYNSSNCEKYKNYAAQCTMIMNNSVANANFAGLYYDLRKHDSSWFNLSLGCSSEKATVRACQTYLEGRLNGTSATSQDTPGLIRGTR